MHLTIAAYGSWGDVRPGIAVGQALQALGHQVKLLVTQDFARMVGGTGLDIGLFPVNKHSVMREVSSRTGRLEGLLAVRSEIAPALQQATASLPDLAAGTEGLIVNEWLLSPASALARSQDIGVVHFVLQPLIATRQHPVATYPPLPAGFPGRGLYNLLTYRLAVFSRWWAYVRPLNQIRGRLFGQGPLSAGGYRQVLSSTPSVTLISQHVLPRPADWPEQHLQTGFPFYDDPTWRPPAALTGFLRSGPAPVYAGFGSMHDRRPGTTTDLILKALRSTGQRAILSPGWAGLGQAGLPDSVYLLDYAPHSWLFPRMAAVVHHAGAGTTAAALRAGVPSVPVPHSGDQPFWARRLHSLGAATRPIPRSRLTPPELAERIHKAVHDPELARCAQELSRAMRSENGARAAAVAVDTLLRQQRVEAP